MGDLDLPSWSLQYLNLHGQVQLQPGAGDLAIIIDFNQSLELLTLPVESRLSLTDICCQVSPLNNLRFGLRFRTDKAWSPYFISWRPCHRIPLGFGLMQNLDLKCSPTRIDIEPDHYNIPLFWQSLQLQSVQLNWINQFMLVRFGGNLADVKFEQSLEPIMTTKLSFSIIMNNLGHGLCHRINTESNLSLSFDWIWLSWTEPGVMTFCHHRVCKLDRQMALQ